MMFTYEDFTKLGHKARVYGEVVIKGYSVRTNNTGMGRFIAGSLESKGTIPFKVWDSEPAFQTLMLEDYTGREVTISGEGNLFNGTMSVIVQTIKPAEEPVGKEAYFTSPYNVEDLKKRLQHIVTNYLTEPAQRVFNMLWAGVKDRMLVEFAAVAHHDNCMHGLMAHTVKTATLSAFFLKNYPTIAKREQDAIILGAIFHDVGKIWSYEWGYYSPKGRELTHNMLGAQYIIKHRDAIVSELGETTYNMLVSVIEQHHGEHGEPPRTLAAYIVHAADNLDAKLTDIESQLNAPIPSDMIKMDDWFLYTSI